MTFLLDQDVPDDLAHWLRHRGHTVICLREVMPITTPDLDVRSRAQAHGAILVTCNRDDFLELLPEGPHPGIVILIRCRTRQAEIAGMQRLLAGAVLPGLVSNINFA
ncbi:MAG TPA: DUF5615 family PIN-like protein [Verrucomicrobiota bacterium]|nr:hypothetical protein [Verrucomicrobiales bacterium]HRI14789.1 DUF5615 family PIN-like protein [Verrucomicrobiota bacterium]